MKTEMIKIMSGENYVGILLFKKFYIGWQVNLPLRILWKRIAWTSRKRDIWIGPVYINW